MTSSTTGRSSSASAQSRSTTRSARTIRVTLGCSGSGPPTISAAGPQSCSSVDSISRRSTGIPWPWRKASEVVSGMASLPGSADSEPPPFHSVGLEQFIGLKWPPASSRVSDRRRCTGLLPGVEGAVITSGSLLSSLVGEPLFDLLERDACLFLRPLSKERHEFLTRRELGNLLLEEVRGLEHERVTILASDQQRLARRGPQQLVDGHLLLPQIECLHSSTFLPRTKRSPWTLWPIAVILTTISSSMS